MRSDAYALYINIDFSIRNGSHIWVLVAGYLPRGFDILIVQHLTWDRHTILQAR
jgi:hypothetical protein